MATRIPTLTPEVVHAIEPLASQDSPVSHDQLARIIEGVGLSHADPGPSQGKVKRLRAVMQYALARDRDAGARFASRLIAAVRASGGFNADSPGYIGEHGFENLRTAYRVSNYELDRDGELRPRLLEHVPATEQHEALRTYVRRVQQGATDAALLPGRARTCWRRRRATCCRNMGSLTPAMTSLAPCFTRSRRAASALRQRP